MEDHDQYRRLVRPPGQGYGNQKSCLAGATTLLATLQDQEHPDASPLTIEGRSLPGNAITGNGTLAINVEVEIEVMLSNISYIERFPWPACGWRRRITAQQLKVSAVNKLDSSTNTSFMLAASIQRGWAPQQKTPIMFQQNVTGLGQPAAWLRVPQATARWQAQALDPAAMVAFGIDSNPQPQAVGVAGDGFAPTAAPTIFYPVTQFTDMQPWPAIYSVLWLAQPDDVIAPWFVFES